MRNISMKTVLLLLFVIYVKAAIPKPGLQTRITQNGFNYAVDVAIEMLMKEIPKITIPDISEKVGPANVQIKNIRIDNMPKPYAAISARPGVGLRWTLSGLSPVVKANYETRTKIAWWTVHKQGSVAIRGSGLVFVLDVLIGRSKAGRPTISATQCNPMYGSVSISFKGGWDDVLNLAARLFKKKIKSLITAQICVKAKAEINDKAMYALNRVSMSETIEKVYNLDFHLVKWPSFFKNYAQLYHKGQVKYRGDTENPPFTPAHIPAYTDQTSRMVYIYITDYLINSGFYSAHRNGKLSINVTSSMLPADAKKYLQTTCPTSICMGLVFPQLSEKYPNSEVEFDVHTTTSPKAEINGTMLAVNARLDAEAYVKSSNQRNHIFTINATIEAILNISVSGIKIKFSVIDVLPIVNVKRSSIGNVGNEFFYSFLVRLATQQFLNPKLQELGEKGFPVPDLKDVDFVNPEIISGTKNVFILGTDVKYTVK